MSELKPCPFCGHPDPKLLIAVGEEWVLCPCGASSGMVAESPNNQRAKDKWNRRTPDKEMLWGAWADCLGMTWGLNVTLELLNRMFERWYEEKYGDK